MVKVWVRECQSYKKTVNYFFSSLSPSLLEKTVFRTIEGEKQEKASLWHPKDWKQWPINSQKKTIFIFSFFLLASLHLCQQPLCWPLFMNQKLLLPLQIEWLTRVFLGSCFSNSLCLAPLFSQLDLKQSCCNWISCFSWKKTVQNLLSRKELRKNLAEVGESSLKNLKWKGVFLILTVKARKQFYEFFYLRWC